MSDADKYMCRHDGCEKVYSQKTNRKRHEKTCSHKKEELSIEKVSVFYCSKSWCSKSFKTKFNCNRHKTTCSRPKRKVTQCYLCKKEFSKLSNLKRHLVVHTKPKKKKKVTEKAIESGEIDIAAGIDNDDHIVPSMVFQDMVFSNDEALVNDQEEEKDDSDQEEVSVSCEQDVPESNQSVSQNDAEEVVVMLDDNEDISLSSSGTAGDFTYDMAESVKKYLKKK